MKRKDKDVHAKGFLDVGDGHKIYWEDWGNPKANPIFSLHGGPGGGFSDRHKTLYDPKKQRVIFHDQRGSGRSTPFASIKNNTSHDLIKDIELLREHLGIKKMCVTGGSWGSTLSLLYAIAHPERVRKLLIWSVFLNRQFEIDFVNEGYPKYFFAEAWERFISFVPKSNRINGNSIMKYYADKINSKNKKVASKYANEWTLYEFSLCSIKYDPIKLEKSILKDKDTLAIAKLETYYFLNTCFVPNEYIMNNINKIKNIPCFLIQGRFDMCTPVISAIDLKRKYGKNLRLHIVNSGHLSSDPEMFSALKTLIKRI